MRVLIVTNHFEPESFRVNDLAAELSRRGHRVKVLTAIPDYPQGRFHDGYGLLRKRCETREDGVEVVRFPVIPRGNGRAFGMMLNYASSLVCSIIYGLWQGLFHKYDCVFVHDTSPAFISIPAQIAAGLSHAPVVHWILDIWPESLVAGGIRSAKVHSAIGGMMKRIYRRDDHILIGSKGFRKLLTERGVPEEKMTYLPNWSDVPSNVHFTGELPSLPQGFNILFAGNLGNAQNLENLLEAAKMTKGTNINWIFVGDGRKKAWMEEYVKENALGDHVFLPGRFPIEAMPHFFASADVLLVALTSSEVFSLTLPAKVQAYMAAAKPVLAVLRGEGRDIVTEASCGICADPDDVDAIAGAAIAFARMNAEDIESMGRNGRVYYENNFERELCMNRIEESIAKSIETFH